MAVSVIKEREVVGVVGTHVVQTLSDGSVAVYWRERPIEFEPLIEFGVSFQRGDEEEVVSVFAPCKTGLDQYIWKCQNCLNLLMRGWRVRQIWEVCGDEF